MRVVTDLSEVAGPSWQVAYVAGSALPGWLVLAPRRHVTVVVGLTGTETATLGTKRVRLRETCRGESEMAVPEYIRTLRAKIGAELLLVPAVTGVVFDDAGRLLLGRRADNGCWGLISGIMEPDEEVAQAVVREVFEETAVRVRPERITGVYTHAGIVHENGDRSCYVVTAFRCSVIEGVPRVNDDESLEVAWFALDALPPFGRAYQEQLDDALRADPAAAFRRPDDWP